MPPIEHLSYSSISAYLACPRAWAFHYVDKVETPTSAALVFGSVFHDAIEDLIMHPDTLPVNAWTKAWNAETEGRNVDWGMDTPETTKNDGIKLLGCEQAMDLIGTIKPLHVEKRVELKVPGVPVPVIGYVDVITSEGPGDFKTSARAWTADRAQDEMQPVFYLAALNQEGYPLKDLDFTHYVFVKTKTPQVQVLHTKRFFSEMFWLFGMIADVWRGIGSEVYPPNPTTWKCNPKYCDYWGMCRGKL